MKNIQNESKESALSSISGAQDHMFLDDQAKTVAA